MHDVIIGHYREGKTSFLGVKNYRIKLKLSTLVEDRYLYNIHFDFSKFLKIVDFMIIFLNKIFFEIFGVKKAKFKKSEIDIL